MTAKYVQSQLEQFEVKYPGCDYGEESWAIWDYREPGESYVVPGLGQVTLVDVQSSNGDGSAIWMVFEVHQGEHKGFYKLSGYYGSYGDGNSWEGPLQQVVPQQRLVTFYE